MALAGLTEKPLNDIFGTCYCSYFLIRWSSWYIKVKDLNQLWKGFIRFRIQISYNLKEHIFSRVFLQSQDLKRKQTASKWIQNNSSEWNNSLKIIEGYWDWIYSQINQKVWNCDDYWYWRCRKWYAFCSHQSWLSSPSCWYQSFRKSWIRWGLP